MEKIFKKRLDKIKFLLNKNKIDYYLESSDANIHYLTNCPDFSLPILIGLNDTYIFVPLMLYKQFLNICEIKDFVKIVPIKNSFSKELDSVINSKKINKIGFCPSNINELVYNLVKYNKKFVEVTGLVEKLRIIKDDFEINNIKTASKYTFQIFGEIEDSVSESMQENFVAGKICAKMHNIDGDIAFPPIVAFGKNSAFPHHIPYNAKLKPNDIMLVDLGYKYKHYCSDLTRVCFLDRIKAQKLKHIHDIVKETKDILISSIKPKMSAKDVDNMARKHLKKYNLDEYFIHGLGHGVGLKIHEAPSISRNSLDILEENMVFTIEPGVYIPNLGGIRLEDTVLLKKDGVEILTI
jgi:Xaa-Pro aminopeptidase